MPKDWPPKRDTRVRRERMVTDANRVSTYGLNADAQKLLRTLVLAIIAKEPEHEEEQRFRHIGDALATEVMQMHENGSTDAFLIVKGVLATELRRYAQRVYRDEFEQAAEPRTRPQQQAFL